MSAVSYTHLDVYKRQPKKSPLSLQMDLSKFTLATEEEKAQQEVMSESTTFFKDGMRKLLKNPLAVGSIIVLILIISAAVVGPMIIPYGYEEMIQVNGRRDKTAKNLGPMEWSKNEQKAIDSGEKLFPHLLGTDEQCRDYLVRILYGTCLLYTSRTKRCLHGTNSCCRFGEHMHAS